MLFSKIVSVAALATLSSALPTPTNGSVVRRDEGGGVNIINNLDSPLYAWSVTDSVSDMHTLSADGGNYQEGWRTNDNGGGISIKLSTTQEQKDVLQFEYTQNGDTIYWDMSCIDMSDESVLTKNGFAVEPSHVTKSCPTVNCHAGDTNCAEAYLQPKDDHATHGCPIDTTFVLKIGN